MKNAIKKIVIAVIVVLLLFLGAWVWSVWDDLQSVKLEKTLKSEVARVEGKVENVQKDVGIVQNKVDERGAAIEGKIDALSEKMSAIDTKLDKVIKLLEPPLPDAMIQTGDAK